MIEPFEIQSVIFCSSQRSGSTMMVDDFSVLNGRTKFESHENFCRMMDDGLFEESEWPQIVDRLNDLIRAERKGLFIENIMYDQAKKVSRKISPEKHDAILTPFYSFFRNAVWVQVIRIDTIEQAISKYFASISNVWDRRYIDRDDYNESIPYDYQELLTHCLWIQKCRQHWTDFFKAHSIEPIVIYYENAKDSYPDYLQPIFQKCGIEFPENLPQRRLKKLGNSRNQLFKDTFIKDLLTRADEDSSGIKVLAADQDQEYARVVNSRVFKLSRKLGDIYQKIKWK